MKQIILISTISLFTLSCKQKDATAEQIFYGNNDSTFILKVQVLDDLDSVKKKVGSCDEAMVYQVLNFKVVAVVAGNYKQPEIKINLMCPLEGINAKHLENGKVYTYKLRPASYINSDLKRVRADFYERWEPTNP